MVEMLFAHILSFVILTLLEYSVNACGIALGVRGLRGAKGLGG